MADRPHGALPCRRAASAWSTPHRNGEGDDGRADPAPGGHQEGRLHPRERPGRRDVDRARPVVRGLADPRPQLGPGDRRAVRGRRQPWYGPAVFRSDDLGETWTQSSEGLTYGDDGPTINDGLERDRRPRRRLRRGRAGGPVPQRRRRRDLGATSRASRPSDPAGWQPGDGGLILHTIVPHPTDPRRMWVGISAVGDFHTSDGGATWETRNAGVRADFMPDPYPVTGQCVHKLVPGRRRAGHALPAEPLRRLPLRRRRRDWEEITRRAAARVRLPDGRPSARPARRPGRSRSTAPTGAATCPTGGRRLADPRRRRHVDPRRRRAAAGRRLPRRPARGDGQRRRSTRSASTSGRAPASCSRSADEGATLAPDRRQPAADLVGRGASSSTTDGPTMADGPPAALARRALPGRRRRATAVGRRPSAR